MYKYLPDILLKNIGSNLVWFLYFAWDFVEKTPKILLRTQCVYNMWFLYFACDFVEKKPQKYCFQVVSVCVYTWDFNERKVFVRFAHFDL